MVRPVPAGSGNSSNERMSAADDGMVEALVAVVVEAHVVGGPAASELVAEGGELAEEVGQVPNSGVSAGFDAQWSSRSTAVSPRPIAGINVLPAPGPP